MLKKYSIDSFVDRSTQLLNTLNFLRNEIRIIMKTNSLDKNSSLMIERNINNLIKTSIDNLNILKKQKR